MSAENGVNDDEIEIDPPEGSDASGPVTSPDQPADVDQQIGSEIASSPTAQGGGPNPDQAPPEQQTATSQSASFKGVPGGPTAVAGIYAQHEAAAGADSAIDQRNTDAQLAQYRKDNASGQQAYQGQIDAAKVYADKDKELQGLIGAEAQRQAAAEKQAQQNWQVERAERLRDYQQQLTAVQQLAMQSGSPFVGMGKGAYLGLAGAEFAQGFLATRGIKIDVSGQIDKFVDQSIQEHQFQVNAMQNVATAKLHLYDVARQSSVDDTEARARYGGMVVAGLQAQVAANANMYQSKLAQSQAQIAQSQLQIKGDEYQNTIVQAYQARAENRLRAEQTAAYRQSEMSIQQFRAQQAAAARAAAPPAAPPSQLMSFTDPGDKNATGGERVAWAVDPAKVGPEAMKSVREATAVVHDQVGLVQGMRDLYKAADVNGNAPSWWKQADNPQYQAFKNKSIEFITQIEQARGGTREVSSASAAKRFDQMVTTHDWTHWGNRGGALDSLLGDQIDHYNNVMAANNADYVDKRIKKPGAILRAHGIAVDDDGYRPSSSGYDAPDRALSKGAFTDAPPPTGTEHALDVLKSRQATASPVALTVEGADAAFDRAREGKEPDVEASPAFVDFLASKGKDLGKAPADWLAENGYRNEYRAVDTLVRNANNGDSTAAQSLAQITQTSKSQASRLVAGHLLGTGERASQEIIDYARFAVKHPDEHGDAFFPSRQALTKAQQDKANMRILEDGNAKDAYDPAFAGGGRPATPEPEPAAGDSATPSATD